MGLWRGACSTGDVGTGCFPPQQRLLAAHPTSVNSPGPSAEGESRPHKVVGRLSSRRSLSKEHQGPWILLERGDVRRLKELKAAQRLRRETRALRVDGFRASARPTPSWRETSETCVGQLSGQEGRRTSMTSSEVHVFGRRAACSAGELDFACPAVLRPSACMVHVQQ